MTDLLTTKQVQTLLRVDRTTIYRMVEAGRLPAIRVGKQWRFTTADVEHWLKNGRYGAVPAAFAGEETAPDAGPGQERRVPTLGEILPVDCAQAVQDAFAEMLGVTILITDMDGHPVTKVSNACRFFDTLLSNNPDGWQHCIGSWQQMARHVALEPKFMLNEMGLLCARGLIRSAAELKGMVVVGGIAPDDWPPRTDQILRLAELFEVEPGTVEASCEGVFRMERDSQERALRFVQRMADVFSQMVQDRLALLSQ